MENQDKLYEQFRQSAQKAEGKGFDRMEAVWNRVEEKLDRKKERRAAAWWKYTGVAAVLLLFVTVGTFLFRNGNVQPQAPLNAKPENNITVIDTQKVKDAVSPKAAPENAIVVTESRRATENGQVVGESTPADLLPPSVAADYGVADIAKAEMADSKMMEPASAEMSETHPIAYTNHNVAGKDDTRITADKELSASTIITKRIPVDNGSSFAGGIYTGTVVDEMQMPLPGASVRIRGTQTTAETDLDGKFSIKAKPGDVLEISYIGMRQQSLTAGAKKDLAVAMEADAVTLDAVVVTAYETTKKRANISAVTTVDKKAIRKEEREGKKRAKEAAAPNPMVNSTSNMAMANVGTYNQAIATQNRYPAQSSIQFGKGSVTEQSNDRPNANLSQTLQGQVPGLNITTGPGAPGATNSIVLRGNRSITGNTDPVYVIDGQPATYEFFKTLDPNEIKRVEVLKDAAATSIYGSRASEGAIIITTKKGLNRKQKKEMERLNKEAAEKRMSFKPQIPLPPTQEDYDTFVENQFENPALAPLSTFSIDVDNASYTNIRRFLNNGQMVPKDAVRIEEMVNFFRYSYPQPKGNEPFSINTEYSDAPWNPKHKLLKIGLQGKVIPEDKLPASNFVFLIDVSGSMDEPNKLPLLKQSMRLLVGNMRSDDKVAIVVYACAAGVVLPPTSGNKKDLIIAALENLKAGGSTAGGQGIELAYKLAAENFIKGGNNRVILATDGDFNVGMSSNSDMQTLIEEKRKSGVFLTCLGYGMGNYKDSKLEILSDKGNGNYAYIDNMQEANRFLQKEFAGSMYAIAKDVKIQIEFNPSHVKAYRLIGYENRKLRDEDFANDAIDAGELGSGHTVTALYEIIPPGVESDYFTPAPGLKYSTVQNTGNVYNNELATIKFRHKKPDSDVSSEMVYTIPNTTLRLEQASADFKFAAAVAWFGLKLRDSKLIPDKATEHIVKLASEGLATDPDGYRAELVRLAGMVE